MADNFAGKKKENEKETQCRLTKSTQKDTTARGAATHVYGSNEINNKMEEKEERREQATICFVGRFRLPGRRLCLRVWNVDVFNKPKRSLIFSGRRIQRRPCLQVSKWQDATGTVIGRWLSQFADGIDGSQGKASTKDDTTTALDVNQRRGLRCSADQTKQDEI